MPAVKRTYASKRSLLPPTPSSPPSSYSSDPVETENASLPAAPAAPESSPASPPPRPKKRKRTSLDLGPFNDDDGAPDTENVNVNLLSFLVPKVLASSPKSSTPRAKKPLTQATLFASMTRSPAIGLPTPPASSSPSASFASKSARSSSSLTPTTKKKPTTATGTTKKKPLTQLHLTLAKSSLATCAQCSLSYTRGAPDDEALHRTHCARISRGTEWGREEARCEGKEVTIVEEGIVLKTSRGEERGRIVKFNASVGGKLGAKLATVLETVNLALSAPPLTPEMLADSKAYLFLISSASAGGTRDKERIVGCVIAQRIKTAMEIVPTPSPSTHPSSSSSSSSSPAPSDAPQPIIVNFSSSPPASPSSRSHPSQATESSDKAVAAVRHDSGLFVSPTPLPTPLGIPRLFVASTHRHRGIAISLLSCAARTFIHGCPLRPELGQVAFSQPTTGGRGVMEQWGKGGIRIYEE